MTKTVPVLYTNLFPTRYEAMDNQGSICIFRADPDGTFFHCRRDGKKSHLKDFVVPHSHELAIYYGPEGGFEIDRRHGELYWCDVSRTPVGPREIVKETCLLNAILFGCRFLGIRPNMEQYMETKVPLAEYHARMQGRHPLES